MHYITAGWSAPVNIGALTTTRLGGSSALNYHSNNLALHVGDSQDAVLGNRNKLVKTLSLPQQPQWLTQTHSNQCIVVENEVDRCADAAVTRQSDCVLAVMTADCLPILLCDEKGTEIAAIHAGWRGLAAGIIENTLKKMNNKPGALLAWTGPAICKNCFETGDDVRQAFQAQYSYASLAFHSDKTKQFMDLPGMAELILKAHGVDAVYHSGFCTFERHQTFYSYRRQAQTGRIATLIWFKQGDSYDL